MIRCKEFFFIRHGQTDHNAGKIPGEHGDVPLNATGVAQAEALEPMIATLNLRMIFCSPMQRAKETMGIVTRRVSACCFEIPEFTECSFGVWQDIREGVVKKPLTKQFMERVKRGLQRVLIEEGPVLIVAHGGVYSAIVTWLDLEVERIIDNCVPVRFFLDPKGDWSVGKLSCILNET